MHALLFVVLIVAPAFLPEKPRANTPVINLVSARELDAILRAAEAPPAPAPVSSPAPAPVAPVVVEPAPAPKPVEPPRPVEPPPPPTKPIEPVPKKEVVKEPPPKLTKIEPRPLPPSPKGKEAPVKKETKKAKEPEPPPAKTAPTKSTVKIADTKTLISRKSEEDAKAKQKAETEERALSVAAAKAAQQAHLQRVAKMKAILGGIPGGLSSPVDIHIDAGGGPNAAAFLDYGQMMVRIYEQMWLVPANLNDSLSIVSVTVTVARNGRVLKSQLLKPSGNSAIDKSVGETLQKVIQFEPFPASFREAQKTFNIDFNLKAKRNTG
jgi:TonB family protein